MKRLTVMLCLGCVLVVSGCTGSFRLTRTIHQTHSTQDERWMDELMFLGEILVLVYPSAVLCDMLVMNTIEFWSGRPQLAAADAGYLAPAAPLVEQDLAP